MKLSIIIPAYNVEKYILNTLNSLINQTKKEFEIIVVNDGSSDNTYLTTQMFFEESSFRNYKIINKENKGVSSARNRGLDEADGEYVLFLDADDYLLPSAVENILNIIEDTQKYDVICWGFDIVREDQSYLRKYFDCYEANLSSMSGEEALRSVTIKETLWICTGSAVYKKDFLNNFSLKYTEGCINGEDLEFTYKVLSKAKKVKFIKKVLTHYIMREGSISNSYNINKFDAVDAMVRACDFITKSDISSIRYIDVVEYLMNQRILFNYYCSLHSCWNYSYDKNIRRIMKDIEKAYPGLNRKMRDIMKTYKGKDLRMICRNIIFLISPSVFFELIKIKKLISKCFGLLSV